MKDMTAVLFSNNFALWFFKPESFVLFQLFFCSGGEITLISVGIYISQNPLESVGSTS